MMPNAAQDWQRWLTLHHLPVSSARVLSGIEALGSVARAFDEWHSAPTSLSPTLTTKHLTHAGEIVGKASEWLADARNRIVTFADSRYPSLLRTLADPPLALYCCGAVDLLETPQIAIVGSRNPTPGGLDNATAFAHHLAEAGLTVTSGLALGIDGAAHQGALNADGRTIAVFGTGVDRIYPPRHRPLAHAIANAGGLLVSEFALGSPPKREHFPRRNRLISGLSLGVLVVEAAVQSGSLITARLAGEQGREVFAIPGSIHSPLARGCHALIRQGAKLVETAHDVLEELRWQYVSTPDAAVPTAAELDPREVECLQQMGFDPIDVDTLVERSGLTIDVVSSMLTAMELRGLITAYPGGKFLRTTDQGLR